MWRKVKQKWKLGVLAILTCNPCWRELQSSLCSLPISHHPGKARQWERGTDLEPNASLSDPPLHWPTFYLSNHIHPTSIQWGKKSKNTCHVDRTIGWLNFSFFSLLLCSQTQLHEKFKQREEGSISANSCFGYFLFSPPQTDSPLAKRNVQSTNIDSKDSAIYMLMQSNKSHCRSLGNYLARHIFVFCFQFNTIAAWWS